MIHLSPPADIRLCSREGRDLLKYLFETNYGNADLIEQHIILLNKIAGVDRRDQVIVDGHHVASISFDIVAGTYKIDLELAGAILLAENARKNLVICDEALQRGHIKGKWLDPDRIITFDDCNLIDGSSVILKIGEQVGVGIVRNRFNGSKAIRVKGIGPKRFKLGPVSSDINLMVKANESHLERLEQIALKELREYFKKTKQPINVSFSGGKDSLAALILARKANRNIELLFVDTGLEFPETVKYVENICTERKLKLHFIQETNKFFDQLNDFGPPAKDFRWCCKTNKLGPLTTFIQEHYPSGCITVEGRRVYESFSRAKIGPVEKNPFVPNQTTLCPIRNWNALEVMLYIHWNKMPLNPLYELDYERIGCWLCPSALQSELANTKKTHPQLYQKWISYLHDWAKQNGLDAKYVDWGLWRWRKHPPKILELAQTQGVSLKSKPSESKVIQLEIVQGPSQCGLKYSIEAALDVPMNFSFDRVAKSLVMLGKTKYSDELGVVKLTLDHSSCAVFANGNILIIGPERGSKHVLETVVETILRVQLCTRCGICEKSCPQKAIRIVETLEVDEKKCNHCGRCAKGCIIANQAVKLIPYFAK
jgi:phosphoadenosine phosphosulfate reductase